MDVRTGSGVVRGSTDDGVARFLGIPYAAAPSGTRRMAPPAPVGRWDGVRDATVPGPTVPKATTHRPTSGCSPSGPSRAGSA